MKARRWRAMKRSKKERREHARWRARLIRLVYDKLTARLIAIDADPLRIAHCHLAGIEAAEAVTARWRDPHRHGKAK